MFNLFCEVKWGKCVYWVFRFVFEVFIWFNFDFYIFILFDLLLSGSDNEISLKIVFNVIFLLVLVLKLIEYGRRFWDKLFM